MIKHKGFESLISQGIVYGIKTSFQDQGQDFNDILPLKNFCDWWHIPLVLKLGGAQAIRDIKEANKLQINHLVAPMIQSKFALEKFILAVQQHSICEFVNLSVNIQTITAVNNIDEILSAKNINSLDGVVVGRVDLMNSITGEKYKGDVDSQETLTNVRRVLRKSKELGLITKIGGSITKNSKQFLKQLIDDNLLDYFETRNVIFDCKFVDLCKYQQIIEMAVEFQMQLLIAKRDYYQKLFKANDKRLSMLKNRLSYLEVVDKEQKENVCVDFDGVIHNDHLGFYDGTIYGDIIQGSKKALQQLSEKYNVILFTAKAKSDRPIIKGKTGIQLIWQWLEKYNIKQYVSQITAQKPRALCYIDDKAIRYQNNNWNSILNQLLKQEEDKR